MKKESLKLKIQTGIYPKEAIYAASYVFIDKVYIYLFLDNRKNIVVDMKAKDGTTKKKLEEIKGEFQNELLNASLRISLEKSNKKIRQNIIERALFSSMGEDDIWSEDQVESPVVPWEENRKKK